MSATVYFLPDQKSQEQVTETPRMFCADEAIQKDEEGDFVWVIDDKTHAQKIRVNCGGRKDGRAEILSGLSGNEKIIGNPPPDLQSIKPLKLQNSKLQNGKLQNGKLQNGKLSADNTTHYEGGAIPLNTSPDANPIVEIKNVTKEFRRDQFVIPVLSGINLTLNQEITCR